VIDSVRCRLKPTRSELGGWPPLVVSFQHFYDKEAVLKRTDMLDRSGLVITEDMSRAVREHWGELNKFMARVGTHPPYTHLQLHFAIELRILKC
jgi:hypothetical protein